MNVDTIYFRRAGIIRDLRNIHEAAERENRDLTPDEKRYWDVQMQEVQDLTGAIKIADPILLNGMPERGNFSRSDYVLALHNHAERAAPPEYSEGRFLSLALSNIPVGSRYGGVGGDPGFDPDVGVRGWRDAETGREVRLFRRNERAFPDPETHLPDGMRADEVSVGKWFRGVTTGNWRGAEAERRLMATYDNSSGGYLMPHVLSARVIDLARAQSCLMKAGALTLPMTSKELTIARITSDPTGYWKMENATGTASDIGVGRLRFTAKTLIALVKMSVELIEDAPNIDEIVEQVMSESLRVELDRAGLFGEGASNEPLGLYYNADLSEYDLGTNGAELTAWDDVLYGIQDVEEANAPSNPPFGILYSPRTNKDFARMKSGDGHYLIPPPPVQKMKHVVSTQVSDALTHGTETAASVIFLGAFGNVLMGIRQNVVIEFSRVPSDSSNSAFKDLQVWARAYLRADIQVERPAQLCRIVGVAETA